MAGHSKWSTIKRKKGVVDEARSKLFQKLAKEIYVYAKQGDKDPKNNPNLRMVIEKAKGANMPFDKIQKAIDKAHGTTATENYESIRYEGYGVGGIAIMVDTLTDNRNRTAANIRFLFTKHNGNLGTSGNVSYLFERKGLIVIANTYDEEKVMMNVIDNGAVDFKVEDEEFIIITEPDLFIKVKEGLMRIGVEDVIVSKITFIPTIEIEVDPKTYEQVKSLILALDDCDDTLEVYHNMKE